MKKRGFEMVKLVICLTFGLMIVGCASTFNTSRTIDNSISLEEQAQLVLHKYISLNSFDGKTVAVGRGGVINVPPGEHEFTFSFFYKAVSGGGGNYTDTYYSLNWDCTLTLLPGRQYYVYGNLKTYTGGRYNVEFFAPRVGYSEHYRPGPDETLVVFRNNALDDFNIRVNEVNFPCPLEKRLTTAVLLPRGEHTLYIYRGTSIYEEIKITAGGGNKRFFYLTEGNLFSGNTKLTEKRR